MIKLVPVLAVLSVSAVLAQRHAPADMNQHHIDRLATSLSLSDTQKEKATSLYKTARASTAALRESLKQAHTDLRTAVQKNDTVAIDQSSLQIGNLMAQEMSVQSKADAAFRQTLTADQQTKMDRMHLGDHGPGGPPPGMARPDHAMHHPLPPSAQ